MPVRSPAKSRESANGSNPLFNQSLGKGLAVLHCFDAAHRSMTIAEVSSAIEMNRSSVQRLIYTLEHLGYLRKQAKTGRYQLTARTLNIGCNYLSGHTLIDIANPFLAELSNFSRETVCLTEPDGLEMVYIARFVSSQHIPMHMPIGSRIPMYCTASGRAILSALPEAEARGLLEASPRVAHTPTTCTDVHRLLAMLEEARQRGYTFNQEELFLGDMAIASPVVNAAGRPVASVHIVVPTSRWTPATARERLASSLIACTRALTNSIRGM